MAPATPSAVSRSSDVLERDVRRDARGPEFFEDVEFAAHPAVMQDVGEPAQLVFLLHATRAQRGFVQRREAHRVDLAALRKVEREPQRIEHERAVGRRSLRRCERRCIPARPFQPGDRRARFGGVVPGQRRQVERDPRRALGRFHARTLCDQPNARIRQRGRVSQHLGHELGADTRRIAGDERNGCGHSSSSLHQRPSLIPV